MNAVLRRLAASGGLEPEEPWIRLSHPGGLWERWQSRYGRDSAIKLMEWNNSIPDLGGVPFGAPVEGAPGRYMDGYRYRERAGRLDPASLAGFYVQDEAAALVGRGAAELPGRLVVETCAAPGGKTAHLAVSDALTVSMDRSVERMMQWKANSRRLGWKSCMPVIADGSAIPLREADKVIVDAPCTGTGVYRRRNDARWGWSDAHLSECVETQSMLLDASSALVRPGGWLVYSVCSLEPEESFEQAARFERRHEGFRRGCFPAPEVLVRDGMLCIFPPEHRVDGHFAVCWERIA